MMFRLGLGGGLVWSITRAKFLGRVLLRLWRSLHRLAGRGRPAATHFSLLRQRKVSKRKATRSLGPYASLRATCGARAKRGLAKLAFGSNNAIPDPSGPPLLGASTRGGDEEYQIQIPIPEETRTRHGESLLYLAFFVFCPRSRLPRPGWAEERRRRRIRDRACLSEASLAGPRLARAPQVARSEA